MASKVNTKFIVILVLALGAAAVLLGGLYVMKLRGDAGLRYRRGLEAYAAGDLRKARDQFGRAVHKEPGNFQYLAKLEEVTLKIHPNTAEEARDLYVGWLGILQHAARHDQTNATHHLRLVHELFTTARRSGQHWAELGLAAEDMGRQLAPTDPSRNLAAVYRVQSVDHRAEVVSLDELIAAERDLEDAMPNLQANVDKSKSQQVDTSLNRDGHDGESSIAPGNRQSPPEIVNRQSSIVNDLDLAWSTLALSQLTIGDKMRGEGRSGSSLAEQYAKADATLEKALAAEPDGPEVAWANLARQVAKRGANPESVTDEQLAQAADHLAATIKDDSDPGLVSDAAGLVTMVPKDGLQRAIDLRQRYLARDPAALDFRLMEARLWYMKAQMDPAQQAARQVLDAPTLTVSLLGQLQPELRKQAASLLVDIQAYRWDETAAGAGGADDRALATKSLEDARETLAKLANDPANDPLVIRADGKIAYARGDFAHATQYFDRLVRDMGFARDPEALIYSAGCLERLNQVGLAYERVCDALRLRPGMTGWLLMKARLAYAMGRKDEAAAILAGFPKSELESNEQARRLAALINSDAAAPLVTGVQADPITAALNRATQAMSKGETDSARNTLEQALAAASGAGAGSGGGADNPQLLQALAAVEISAGQMDKARQYTDRGLARDPKSLGLLRIQALLKFEDPIESLGEFLKTAVPDEKQRVVAAAVNYRAMAAQQDILAARLEASGAAGDAPAAAKARDLAARAKAQAAGFAAQAQQLAPDDPQLLEYQLNDALEAKDWARVDQVIERAKTLDADQAKGGMFKGRAQLIRATQEKIAGNSTQAAAHFQEAVHSLEAAVERIPFSSQAWKTLAFAYEGLGVSAQAERAFAEAYKCNPNDLDLVRVYLMVLSRRGDQARALTVVRSAHELAPQDANLRHFWLSMESESGNTALALRERRMVYQQTPADRTNAAELARLLGQIEPAREHLVDASGSPLYSEARWARMPAEEREQAVAKVKADWAKEADAILDALAVGSAGAKDELALLALRASLLRSRGEVAAGEQLLNQYIGRAGANVTAPMLLELARYQYQASHFTEAIKTYEEAARHQDPKRREADLELAQLYMKLSNYAEALKHLDLVLEVAPTRSTQNQSVECLLKLQKLEEAQRRLQEVIASGGEDHITTTLQASIAEGWALQLEKTDKAAAERKYAEQRDALARAEAQQPSSPTPRLLLAQSLIGEYRRTQKAALLEDALGALARAEKVSAGLPEISFLRAEVLRLKEDTTGAIGELQRLLQRRPDLSEARARLVQLFVNAGQDEAAMALVDDAIRLNPTLPAWHEAKGDLCKKKRDAPGALAAYSKACDLAPTPSLLLKTSDAAFASSPPECKAVIARLSMRPDDLALVPMLREAYARALVCEKRRDEALDQLRQAYASRRKGVIDKTIDPAEMTSWFQSVSYLYQMPDGGGKVDASAAEQFTLEMVAAAGGGAQPDLYELRGMAGIWLHSGDPKVTRAIELQRQALDKCPVEEKELRVRIYMELAAYQISAGSYPDVVSTYQSVIELDPKNVEALNNLAFVVSEQLNDPAKALPYAERALALDPNNASVLDTLGWAHHLAGNSDMAVSYLDKSIQVRKMAGTYVHMVEVLIKAGDFAQAQKYLDEAEKLNLDPVSRQKIITLKDDIRNRRSPGK